MSWILKTWIWITFLRHKKTLPSESNMVNPKFKFEWMSGAFIWEDEGLWEHRSHHFSGAFKYVIKHRMQLIAGSENDTGFMRSKKFDKQIFEMARKHFPNWVGFDVSRCSFDSNLANRIKRIEKVEEWRMRRLTDDV